VRYWKGSIALSTTHDYPLLRQALHSGFITHSQLFQFMRLDHYASSRNAFNNRVLRLVKHGLLVRHELPFINREAVYSLSEVAASEMAGKGECYARPFDHPKSSDGQGYLHHSLDLNEIHLALKRTGTLVYWTPETEIRSRNDLTTAGYWKYYDAVVVVRLAGQDYRFALEYERTPKAARQYLNVRQRIEQETSIAHFLYLMPNYDLLWFVADKLSECTRAVHFGLLKDFLQLTLALPVRRNGSPVSITLASVLTRGQVVPKTGALWENIAV
jgi:hypothetical protein